MSERLLPRLVIVFGRSAVEIDAPVLEICPDWHRLRGVSHRQKVKRSEADRLW